MERLWARLEIKSVDSEQRILRGIATTASTDRMHDVVEPAGAEYTLPLPLLYSHDSRSPVGEVFAAKTVGNGIQVEARIAKTDVPGPLKDRLDLAWESLKLGLIKGLSIGFTSLEQSYNQETGGFHFLRWAWLELSLVVIPANQDCSILAIKSVDQAVLQTITSTRTPPLPEFAATGKGLEGDHRPGATGSARVSLMRTGTTMAKKSYADLIAQWEATRKAKTDRMDAILEKTADTGETLDATEKEEHDLLAADVKEIDDTLTRFTAAETREKATAVAVDEGRRATGELKPETERRTSSRITVAKTLPKGIAFARWALCEVWSKGIRSEAMRLAKENYPDDSGVAKLVELGGERLSAIMQQRTAVAAAATSGSHWADDLVPYTILDDFIEYLRPGSILGKFGGPNPGGGADYPALRKVPFNIRVSGASAGLTAAWKGEALPALPSKMTTFNTTLTWAHIVALAILTKEEIRFSNPNAETVVRNDLSKAINTRADVDFVDPALAVSANVHPASITNGIAATAPSTTSAAALITDLGTMIKNFPTNNLDPSDIVLIMSASQALEISLMTTTLGFPYFPDITMKGGTLRGFPVITSENLASVGSPSTGTIVAVKASEVYLADDGVVTIDASDQAAVEMQDSSSVSGISGTGASLVSLWQTGMLGLLASREITWKLRRSTAVQYISPAAYAA